MHSEDGVYRVCVGKCGPSVQAQFLLIGILWLGLGGGMSEFPVG